MRGRVLLTVLWRCAIIGGPRANAFLLSPGAARHSVRPLDMVGAVSAGVRIKKDVVVIGGGLAGLSTALELAKRGRQVTVVSRNRAEAAAEAAGGMIAPQAERLESGPYLDLCLTSREMYAEWVSSLEAIAGTGGEKGTEKPEAHFWSSGGFMSPAFEGDAVHVWDPPPEGGQAYWIERDQVRWHEVMLLIHNFEFVLSPGLKRGSGCVSNSVFPVLIECLAHTAVHGAHLFQVSSSVVLY